MMMTMKTRLVASKEDLALKGCPVCEGGATLWEQIKTTTTPSRWVVRCDECKLESTSMVELHKAVQFWNSREGINLNTLKNVNEITSKSRSRKRDAKSGA